MDPDSGGKLLTEFRKGSSIIRFAFHDGVTYWEQNRGWIGERVGRRLLQSPCKMMEPDEGHGHGGS